MESTSSVGSHDYAAMLADMANVTQRLAVTEPEDTPDGCFTDSGK